jgi:hypothetical protein
MLVGCSRSDPRYVHARSDGVERSMDYDRSREYVALATSGAPPGDESSDVSSSDELPRTPEPSRIRNDLLGKTVNDPVADLAWSFDYLEEFEDSEVVAEEDVAVPGSMSEPPSRGRQLDLSIDLKELSSDRRFHVETRVVYRLRGGEWSLETIRTSLVTLVD